MLMLFTVPLVFSRATTEVYGLVKVATVELFAVALLVLISRRGGLSLPYMLFRKKHQVFVFLFLAVAAVSLVNAVNIYAGLEALYLLAAYMVVFLAVSGSVEKDSHIRKVATAIILAGVTACAWSIYQNKGLSFTGLRYIYSSTFGNPIFFSQYLSVVIPLSIAMAVCPRLSLGQRGGYLAGAALALLLLIAARSRGAYLGLTVAGFYCYIVLIARSNKRIRNIILSATAALTVLVILAGAILWPRLGAYMEGRQLQNMMRVHVWHGAANMIKDRPLLGVGAGNFEYAYPLYRTQKEKEVTPKGIKYTRAHNQLLQIWSEMGIFGLLAFLGLVFFVFRKRATTRLGIGIKAGLIALLAQSLFNPMLEIPTSGLLFWALLGILVSRRDGTGTQPLPECKEKRLFAMTRGALCAAFAILAPISILRPLIADYYMEKAEVKESERRRKDAILDLEKSLKVYPHSWEALFLMGKIYQATGVYPKAADYYSRAARYHPNYPVIWNNLGTASMQADMPDPAINAFRRAIDIDDTYIGAHYNLALVYKNKGDTALRDAQLEKVNSLDPAFMGNMYLESGIFDDAALEFQKAIRRDPFNIEANFKLAEVWNRRNEVDKAIERYKKTVELGPAYLEAHMALAVLYKGKGDLAGAVDSYKAALESISKRIADLSRDILFYSEMGIYPQVVEKSDKIKELGKVKINAHKELASIYSLRGQINEAIEAYEGLLKGLPDDPDILEGAASIYQKEGMYKKAADAYSGVIKADPGRKEALEGKVVRLNRIAAHNALAKMYEDQGLPGKAIDEYRKILDIEEGNFYALRKLGRAYAMAGRIDAAKDALGSILKAAPDDVEGRIAMGDLMYQIGEIEEAGVSYAHVVYSAPSDIRGALALAGFYRKQGMLAEAEEIYRKAIGISPRDARLRLNLATLMEEKGDVAAAKKEYEEVLRLDPDNQEARIRVEALSSKPASQLVRCGFGRG